MGSFAMHKDMFEEIVSETSGVHIWSSFISYIIYLSFKEGEMRFHIYFLWE